MPHSRIRRRLDQLSGELGRAHQRLRVDGEPAAPRVEQQVAAVEVLVQEHGLPLARCELGHEGTRHVPEVGLERRVVPDVLEPLGGSVGEHGEGMAITHRPPQSRHHVGHQRVRPPLVGDRPQLGAGTAALDQQGRALGVVGE
jgi:hypothetical protein